MSGHAGIDVISYVHCKSYRRLGLYTHTSTCRLQLYSLLLVLDAEQGVWSILLAWHPIWGRWGMLVVPVIILCLYDGCVTSTADVLNDANMAHGYLYVKRAARHLNARAAEVPGASVRPRPPSVRPRPPKNLCNCNSWMLTCSRIMSYMITMYLIPPIIHNKYSNHHNVASRNTID